MTESKTPKSDRQRELREAAYAARLKAPSYDGVREKLAAQDAELKAIRLDNAKAAIKSVTPSVTRVRKWREANPELNKTRNAGYQRKKRQAEKTNAPA